MRSVLEQSFSEITEGLKVNNYEHKLYRKPIACNLHTVCYGIEYACEDCSIHGSSEMGRECSSLDDLWRVYPGIQTVSSEDLLAIQISRLNHAYPS